VTSRFKVALIVVAVPLLLVAVAVSRQHFQAKARQADPAASFRELTGRALPAGVRAAKYRSAINDNFMRTTHYWLLEGGHETLRNVLVGTEFVRSDEDAKWVAPNAALALEIQVTPDNVAEGYEWERDRDGWFLILKDVSRAIYVH
jgi:hypothetical protein